MSHPPDTDRRPLAFPARPDVPILGQPMTLKGWLVQLLVTCNCSPRPEPLLIIGQAGAISGPCPVCGHRFVLQSVGADARGGLMLNVGRLAAEPDASPPAIDPVS